jgi:hypothetical protein
MPSLVRHTVKRDKYPDTGMLNIFMVWEFNLADPEAEPAVGVVGGWDSKGQTVHHRHGCGAVQAFAVD